MKNFEKYFKGVHVMRVNKLIVLLTIAAMLTPALSVFGVEKEIPDEILPTPNTVFNAPVGVVAGDLIYWDIVQLDVPEPPEGMPDFAGNQIYMKILDVYEHEVAPGVDDKLIFFALGLKFLNDLAFTVGSPPLSTEMIIPAGSATPSVAISAVPHMNQTYGNGPLVVILNDAWNDHELIFEFMGFTVTNDVSTFSIHAENGTGVWDAEWRKSDGLCTSLLIDDIWFSGLNFTGGTVELAFNSIENNPLPLTVGDNIDLMLDNIDATVTGSGDMWDDINETAISEEIAEITEYEGIVVERLVVEEVHGTYYGCGVYIYNDNTEMLEKIPDALVIFNGFQMCYQISEPIQFTWAPGVQFFGGIMSPWITPDWDIYEAQAKLLNTFIGVYITDIIQLMGINEEEMMYHSISGAFSMETKRGYHYFYEAIDWEIEENLTYTTSIFISILDLNQAYEEGYHQTVAQEGYMCYTDTGVWAALRVKAEIDVEVYDTNNATAEGTGTMRINVDVKVRNPDYDPPDIIKGGGILPGFNWMIFIPALATITIATVIIRRRKK
jgi:hypothetical protein